MRNVLRFRIIVATLLFSLLLVALSVPKMASAKTSHLNKGNVPAAGCSAAANSPIASADGVEVTGNIQCFGSSPKRVDIQVDLYGDGVLLNSGTNGGLFTSFVSATTSSNSFCQSGAHMYKAVVSGSWTDNTGFKQYVTTYYGPPSSLTC